MERGVDINITAIERNLRLYAAPGSLALLGLAGLLLVDPSGQGVTGLASMAVPIKRVVFAGAGVLTMVGALWLGYRGWLEWRWERGSVGGCRKCGGSMQRLNGRYGPYSKCLMCGVKRKGYF
jgi:hypothetical protein